DEQPDIFDRVHVPAPRSSVYDVGVPADAPVYLFRRPVHSPPVPHNPAKPKATLRKSDFHRRSHLAHPQYLLIVLGLNKLTLYSTTISERLRTPVVVLGN